MGDNCHTRVKLYKLNSEGGWDDWGTGQVSVGLQDESPVIHVNGDAGQVLLNTRIVVEDIYKQQGDTIITWKDDDKNAELALSFQAIDGCRSTWELIQSAQKYQAQQAQDTGEALVPADQSISLPPPKLENLPALADMMEQLVMENKRSAAAEILRQSEYIGELLSIFSQVEDLEDWGTCVLIFKIINGMVGLVHPEIVLHLVSSPNYKRFFGVLEYDPALKKPPKHREFLAKAVFRQEIPIEDEAVRQRIQQNYRLQYLEHILPRVLDDPTINMLHKMIMMNNQTIITQLQNSDTYTDNLLAGVGRLSGPLEKRLGCLELLLNLVKTADDSLQEEKPEFFRTLCAHKEFFPTLHKVLAQKVVSHQERTLCARMLFYLLRNIRQACRTFCIDSKHHPDPPTSSGDHSGQPRSLLTGIINLLTCEEDRGIQADAATSLNELFHGKDFFFEGAPSEHDPMVKREVKNEALTQQQNRDKEACLSILYERYMVWIVQPFSATCRPGAHNAMIHLADFLSNCVLNHGYRAKYFILQNGLIDTVVQLCDRKEKTLQIASVRFLLACIQVKESAPFYHRYIAKNDLFKRMFACFFATSADDMLKASICNLIDVIATLNCKVLVKYIAKQYGERLRACAYCKETFALILRKYAQNEDFEHNKDQFTKDDVGVKMSQDQLRYLENQREESYFDEDDSVPARPPAAAAFSSAAAAPLPHTQPSPATHFLDENPFKRRKI